jgi:transposase-like protein
MGLLGGGKEPGSKAFRPCPECGHDEIYSESDGLLSRTRYHCNSCGYEADKEEVKKSFSELQKGIMRERQGKEAPKHDESYVHSLVENAEGPGVTVQRLRMNGGTILDALEEGEQPHSIIKGAGYRGIEVERGDEIQRTGVKDARDLQTLNNALSVPNMTVPTDSRLLALHPLRTGTDEYSIPYESIDSLGVDRGWIKRRIQVTTRSRTYYFEVGDGKVRVKDAVEFIREMREEVRTHQNTEPAEEPSNLEKLKELSQLHDRGKISDEEFESLKGEFVDEL